MSEFVKPYNNDPFVGNLSTPVTTSTATKLYLGNLPIYRKGLSPLLRGLEIGMAHGYFLIGPFYILGPLRNSPNALLVGLFSAFGLILNYLSTTTEEMVTPLMMVTKKISSLMNLYQTMLMMIILQCHHQNLFQTVAIVLRQCMKQQKKK